MTSVTLRPAFFLDRDGVIIENRADYVKSLAEVQFIPGALTALARLARYNLLIVIVTNQSAIGRGIVARETVDAINAYVVGQIVSAGGRVDGLYLCPHHPQDGCACRKPAPGMLLEAARDLDVDLAASVMIGDALTDVQAAEAVRVEPILVLTGLGSAQVHRLTPAQNPLLTVPDLAAAVEQILNEKRSLTKTPPE